MRVERGRDPVFQFDLGDHQEIVGVAHYWQDDRVDRITVDHVMTVWVVSRLTSPDDAEAERDRYREALQRIVDHSPPSPGWLCAHRWAREALESKPPSRAPSAAPDESGAGR